MIKRLVILLFITLIAVPSYATKTFIKGTLTGGVSGCLDEIDGAELSDGDRAIIVNSSNLSAYILDADSGATADGTNVVTPVSNAGTKRWLVTFANLNIERGFYSDDASGANIHRIRDRILLGDAADYDGKGTPVTTSWLGALGDGTSTTVWMEQNARLAAVTARGIGLFGGAGSSEAPGTGGGSLGVVGYAINDDADVTHNVWGGYFEAVRETGTGQAAGIEINVTNLGTSPNVAIPNPYNTWSTEGTTIGISVASGGGAAIWPTSYAADIGIEFHPNSALFRAGIIFRNGALVRDGGASGPAHAIMLAYDHQIEWYEYTNNNLAAHITSNVTSDTYKQSLLFHNAGLSYKNDDDETIFTIQNSQDAIANYLYVVGAVADASPSLSVAGTNDHIDVRIVPKGTGYIRYGTRVSNADAAITGYMYIKDNGGTLRKLAIID